MSSEWLSISAADLGREIAAGSIDPIDLTETYLAAIDAHEFRDRIYARVTHDRARSEAAAASVRAKSGLRRSPLDGVPISWKDLFDSAGIATEAGSALLAGRTPETDALVLENATRAGLVCLGKTHMSELAFSGLGLNPVTATPPCVNDHDAVSGGSSSGAAASVAFGLAAAAIGSDTGGSVRIPAAWNDLVGLKTTIGRVPLDGTVPLVASFDTIGPLCRTVEDAALCLALMENTPVPDLDGASLEGTRFLIPETVAFDDIAPAQNAAFRSAVERLQAAGALIERREIACISEAMALSGILFATEAYATWRDVIETAPDKMFHEILARFRSGAEYLATDFIAANQKLDRLKIEWLEAVAPYDGVLLPTAVTMPPNAARLLELDDYYVTQNLLALRNTRIGNLFALCGLTLPTGVPSTGLMMLLPPNEEERLLRLGAAVEQALS